MRIVELDAEPVGAGWPGRCRGREAAGGRRSGRRSGSKTRRRAPAPCRSASRDRCLIHPVRVPRIACQNHALVVPLRHSAAKTRRCARSGRRICISADGLPANENARPKPGVCRDQRESRPCRSGDRPCRRRRRCRPCGSRSPTRCRTRTGRDTKLPSITLVWSSATVEECGSWLKSIDTFG